MVQAAGLLSGNVGDLQPVVQVGTEDDRRQLLCPSSWCPLLLCGVNILGPRRVDGYWLNDLEIILNGLHRFEEQCWHRVAEFGRPSSGFASILFSERTTERVAKIIAVNRLKR